MAGAGEILVQAPLRLAFDNGVCAHKCPRAIAMSLDSALFLSINGSATSPHWLTALALFSTRVLPLVIAGGAAGVLIAGNGRVRWGVLQVFAAITMAFVLARLGQYLIAIDRPFVVGLGTQWLPHGASHSFPSSHASVSTAFAVATALMTRRWYWAISALVVAAVISWSRVYLGLHFPSDVVAGALVGAASGWLACQILPRTWRASRVVTSPLNIAVPAGASPS